MSTTETVLQGTVLQGPSHVNRRVAVYSAGKRLRAEVFYYRPLIHFAAPAPVGCLQRRVFPHTLLFVQRDFFIAAFKTAVLALLKSQTGKHALEAFYLVLDCCPRRPVANSVGPPPIGCPRQRMRCSCLHGHRSPTAPCPRQRMRCSCTGLRVEPRFQMFRRTALGTFGQATVPSQA